MKWTTIKETPLAHYEKVFLRKIGHQGGGYALWDGVRKAFLNDHLFGPQGGKPDEYEYLDESPTTADASVLKEALEKISTAYFGDTPNGALYNIKQLARETLSKYSTQSLPESQESKGGEDLWSLFEHELRQTQDIAALKSKYHITKK